MENNGVILTFIFVILKLCGVIYWSWWWVFCPLWLPIVAGAILFIFASIVCFSLELWRELLKSRDA